MEGEDRQATGPGWRRAPEVGLGDLEDALVVAVLRKVSQRTGGFTAALVSRRFHTLCCEAQVYVRATREDGGDSCGDSVPERRGPCVARRGTCPGVRGPEAVTIKAGDPTPDAADLASEAPWAASWRVAPSSPGIPGASAPGRPALRISDSLVNLRKVSLERGAHLRVPDVDSLLAALAQRCPRLRHLRVEWGALLDESGTTEASCSGAGMHSLACGARQLCSLHLNCHVAPGADLPSTLSCMASLTRLELGWHPWSRVPSGIGQLTALRQLELRTSGELPAAVGELRSLQSLRIEAPALPDSLSLLRSLRHLSVYCPPHSALEGFQVCSSLTWLTSFGLWVPVGPMPEWVGALTRVVELELGSLWGEAPAALLQMGQVRRLHLGFMEVPSGISQLSNLESLTLANHAMRRLPPAVCQLSWLRELCLDSLFNLDRLPESISGLKGLERLTLVQCDLRSLPTGICELPKLQSLRLCKLGRLESLPEGMSLLKELRRLDIQECPGTFC